MFIWGCLNLSSLISVRIEPRRFGPGLDLYKLQTITELSVNFLDLSSV